MHGAEAKRIRDGLSEVIDRPLSERDLGIMLGLPQQQAEAIVQGWEKDRGPEGPALVALWLLALSTDEELVPPHVLAEGADYTPPSARPHVALKAMMGAIVRDLASRARD